MRDTQIAGIVIARRATLATRNVKHFADLKAEVVNPWEAVGGPTLNVRHADFQSPS
jgi:predicted nucleic acid-binding protein